MATHKADELGGYLSSRRKQVQPEDVGLDAGPRRRVKGLRREEVALLAGISVAYYLRLEQGHVTHPSEQVVDALARALQLDIEGTEHLLQLAHLPPKHGRVPTEHVIVDGLDRLIDQIPLPAAIVDRCLFVLASNRCARALSPEYAVGENVIRWRLLDPLARELYRHWENGAENLVRGLREAAITDLDDPRLGALIDELNTSSALFRQMWDRADVGYRMGTLYMCHPRVGELELHRNRMIAPYSGGQHLLIYHGDPGSPTAAALELLCSLPVDDVGDDPLPAG